MNVTLIDPPPAPKPPKEVVIRLSETEARILRTITGHDCTLSRELWKRRFIRNMMAVNGIGSEDKLKEFAGNLFHDLNAVVPQREDHARLRGDA